MPKRSKPRKGSLQFWPRKRAAKMLPSANWKAVENASEGKEGLLGFVGYKAGMSSVVVNDSTENSLTSGENISLPVTIIECPPMKVYSIRFYKNGKVWKDICFGEDKELSRKVKVRKKKEGAEKGQELDKIDVKEVEDIRVVMFSQTKLTGIKKKPDMVEIGIGGSVEDKLKIAKELVGKEINVESVFESMKGVDIRGVTKGKGFVGPVKRFGIRLKQKKSEKGQRRPGSLGAWTPKKVSFRAPMAGQLGVFTRTQFNNLLLFVGSKEDAARVNPAGGLTKYGLVKNPFVLVRGTIPGARKRPLLITQPLRKMKKEEKYDLVTVAK